MIVVKVLVLVDFVLLSVLTCVELWLSFFFFFRLLGLVGVGWCCVLWQVTEQGGGGLQLSSELAPPRRSRCLPSRDPFRDRVEVGVSVSTRSLGEK